MHEHVRPIHLAIYVGLEGESVMPYVRCPMRGESVGALECAGCSRLRSLALEPSGGALVCVTEEEAPAPFSIDRRADCADAAAHAPIHEMLPGTTTCVKTDVPIDEVRRLMAERGLRAVPVVDADGKLAGMVSRSHLATGATFGVIGDMMASNGNALLEDAPVAHAIALMASEDVREIPIVTSEGHVVGMYDALDALRWVAVRMGWVVPDRGARARE